MTALDAFAALHRNFPRTMLLVAGAFSSSDLERAAVPLLSAPGIVHRHYLPEREFRLAAHAIDACINLRSPAAGESSGISVAMMGIGKPVLVTDCEEYARVPRTACLRIASGPAERDSLLQHMILVTSIQGVAGDIGRRASEHIGTCHRVEQAGKQYWDF